MRINPCGGGKAGRSVGRHAPGFPDGTFQGCLADEEGRRSTILTLVVISQGATPEADGNGAAPCASDHYAVFMRPRLDLFARQTSAAGFHAGRRHCELWTIPNINTSDQLGAVGAEGVGRGEQGCSIDPRMSYIGRWRKSEPP